MLTDVVHHLFIGPAAGIDRPSAGILDQLIRTMTGLALLAVHQRIAEAADMTAGLPYLRVHEDRALNAHIVWILLYETLPPCLFHIILEFDAQRTIIPRIGQAAVDLGALKDKARVLHV